MNTLDIALNNIEKPYVILFSLSMSLITDNICIVAIKFN